MTYKFYCLIKDIFTLFDRSISIQIPNITPREEKPNPTTIQLQPNLTSREDKANQSTIQLQANLTPRTELLQLEANLPPRTEILELEANLPPFEELQPNQIEELQPNQTKQPLSPLVSIHMACFANLQSFPPINCKDYQTLHNLKRQQKPYKTLLKRHGKQER